MTDAGPRPIRGKIGPLDAIDFPVDSPEALVVCCHGYGADAADLAPLAFEIPTKRRVRWIFPEAPNPLGSDPMASGREWFPIDQEALMQAQVLGTHRSFAELRPPGLEEAADALRALLDQTKCESLFLGGFSQGSMVAIEAALASDVGPQGVFILSGNLVDGKGTLERASKHAGTPFFQTHGEQDPVLGFEGAQRLTAALTDSGWKGDLQSFQGGHAIPPNALKALGEFIDG